MLRLANLSRNALRSSLREDTNKHGSHPPQFLFMFNDSPGLYTPGPASQVQAISSNLVSSDFVRNRVSPQKDLVVFKDFTEHHQEDGQFEGDPLYNLCRVFQYGAILAVGYNIFHDKTLSRAVQDWCDRSLQLHISHHLIQSHCPVLALKTQKTALAQPLETETTEKNNDSYEAVTSQLYVEEIFDNVKKVIKEPSVTSDYSSDKSESIGRYQFSEEELSFIHLQESIPLAVEALVAIKLVKKGDKRGISQLLELSNLGCPTSHFYLGQAYEQGICVTSDMVEAARYYKMAAQSGHLEAKYNLGVFYLRGEGGCECSEVHGMKLIEEAAQLGLEEAKSVIKETKDEPNLDLGPSLEKLELEQLFHMGEVMEESELNDPFDQLFALHLYQVAAENGHEAARKKFETLSKNIPEMKPV